MASATAASLEGGCACGKSRYRLESAPMFVQACHCRDCQRQTGGPFVINLWIEADRVLQTAGPELLRSALVGGTGKGHDVLRCAGCGTALWSEYHVAPGSRFVRAATLDRPELAPPAAHIWTGSKLPWLQLPADVPSFETYYDMAQQWPAESLRRIKALRDRAKQAQT
jgi:hypothetical protein